MISMCLNNIYIYPPVNVYIDVVLTLYHFDHFPSAAENWGFHIFLYD